MYVSLHQLIQPYLETSFDNLPDDVQNRVLEDFPGSWNRDSPGERSSLAQEADAKLDPARSVHAYWFKLQSEILGIERNIEDLNNANDASEADSRAGKLAALTARVAVLHESWCRPDNSAEEAQLAAKKALSGQLPVVLDTSKALQFLSENTGVAWTEAQLLSLVSNSDICLYAAVPPWTPMYIVEEVFHKLRALPFVKPASPVLIMLSPEHVQELWVNGQTLGSTWVAADDFSTKGPYVYLERPVTVLRSDLRLTGEELLQILKKWEASRQPIAPVPVSVAFAQNLITENAALAKRPLQTEMEAASSSPTPRACRSLGTAPEWVLKARVAAEQYIDRHRASNLYPSLKDVCDHVEGKLRVDGVLGANGRPVSATYIGRNALQGDWWRVNKP